MKKKNSIWYIKPDYLLVLRTSLIKQYLKCPAACYFRYFLGLVIPPKSAMMFGSVFHYTADKGYTYKRIKGRVEKLSVWQDRFNQEFKTRKKGTHWLKAEKPNKIKDEGVYKIIPQYYKKRAKKIEPLYTEESFKMDFPQLSFSITGTLDLVQTDELIRDHKCKGRTPNWVDIYKSIQKDSYMLGYEYKFGRRPAGFMEDYIIRKKEPEIKASKILKPKGSEQAEFLATARRVVKSIRLGLFYPRKESNFFCSPNACGYWSLCRQRKWIIDRPFDCVYGKNN